MAFNEITITAQTRPCWAKGRRAMFHRWTDSARPALPRGVTVEENAERFQIWSVHGLVEYEDGTVERVWPNEIQFIDTFNPDDYYWGECLNEDQHTDADAE